MSGKPNTLKVYTILAQQNTVVAGSKTLHSPLLNARTKQNRLNFRNMRSQMLPSQFIHMNLSIRNTPNTP